MSRGRALVWGIGGVFLGAGAAWTALAAIIGANAEYSSSDSGSEGGLALLAVLSIWFSLRLAVGVRDGRATSPTPGNQTPASAKAQAPHP